MDYEIYKILRQEDILEKAKLRQVSENVYKEAVQLAKKAGWILRKHSEVHYSIWSGTWLLNFYPGNSRIWYDPNKRRGPFLKVGINPTILDVVQAAIKANGIEI